MMLAVERLDSLHRISTAWFPFIGLLARALKALRDDQFLILTVKGTNRFVQFYARGAHGMRLEAVSNEFLSGSDRLEPAQLARLDELGWRRPSGSARTSTALTDPDGSPNHHIDVGLPLAHGEIAAIAVRTLREVMAAPHPQFLEYSAADARGNALELPALGLLRSPPEDRRASLERRVLTTVEAVTGIVGLAFDEHRTVGLRHGTCAILIRPSRDEAGVVLDSPLLVGVEQSAALLAELNVQNAGEGRLRFSLDGDTVNARCEIALAAFTPTLFAPVLDDFSEQCEAMAEWLQASFGGCPPYVSNSPLRMLAPVSRARH